MIKTTVKALCAIALMALAGSALATKGEPWLTNMDEAQKIAKAQDKDIFMFFTGSDWCGWCIKLDNEVLSKQAFLDYAKDNLVLVDLDFPRDEELLSEEQQAHNDEWIERFPVQGFPTVYLTDASANRYAMTGYRAGGPDKYVEHLKQLRADKAAVANLNARAAKATGLERATLLDTLLSNESAIIEDRDAKMSEIMALTENKDDALYNKYRGIKGGKDLMNELMGLRGEEETSAEEDLEKMLAIYKKYNYIKEGRALHALLGTIGDQFIATGKDDEGVAFMDTIVTNDDYPLDIKQATALFKGIITINVDENKQQQAIEFFDKAIEMDPDSRAGKRAQHIKQSIADKTAQS